MTLTHGAEQAHLNKQRLPKISSTTSTNRARLLKKLLISNTAKNASAFWQIDLLKVSARCVTIATQKAINATAVVN